MSVDQIKSELPATRPAGPVGTVPMGLMPQSLEEGWRLAQMMAQSALVPEDFRGHPENVLVALQLGAEVGFPPMQALQSIAVINGRPSIWGDGFLALLMSSAKFRGHEEWYEVAVQRDKGWIMERRDGLVAEDWNRDDSAAVCAFWRIDREAPIVVRFTVGQAKKAGLLGKKGPWQDYPDRMLRLRARSWCGRDAFPDVLRGLVTREEALDRRDVIDTEPVQPRRASEVRASSAPSNPIPQPESAPGNAKAPPASPAPSEPATASSASPAPARTQGQAIRGLLITHTCFVKSQKQSVEPYYEITAKTTTGAEKRFITRDERLFKEASSFWDTDARVVATVHAEGTDLVIDALEIYEGGAAEQNGGGELFR
jgi:hypothetical protein